MKNTKALQISSKGQIERDQKLDPVDVLNFLEDFQRVIAGDEGRRKLISLRVPDRLLEQFQKKAKNHRISYQTQIVELMRQWIK
jgi:predicted DNA binding CopG/RHH family protein